MYYTLAGSKGGAVRFQPSSGTIQAEQVAMTSKVTSYPVEDGSSIDDHVIKDPIKFTISGTLIGGDAAKATLEAMWEGRDLITYTGRIRLDTLAITSLSFDTASKNLHGYAFKMAFQKVNLASAAFVSMGPMMSQQSAGTNSQTRKTGNSGLQTAYTEMHAGDKNVPPATKTAPSTGPSDRVTPSYSGLS